MQDLYFQLLIGFLVSLCLSMVLIPGIIRTATRFSLVDIPNERKVHTTPVPRFGGVAIFGGAVCGTICTRTGLHAVISFPVFFSGLGLLFLVGVWDDLKDISAKLRFLIQICCGLAVAVSGIRITSLHGMLGLQEIEPFWQYVVTVLIVVGATNAFNLIGGVDGLAGGLATIGILVLVWISWQLQAYSLALLLVTFSGAIIGFLRFNMSPAKIFMGDGGSLVLGYLLSVSGIMLVQRSQLHPELLHPSKVAVLVTSILIIPVFDTLRVFAHRIKKGRSPFQADKTHIHHLFLVAGMDHRKTCFFLYGLETLLVCMAFLFSGYTGMPTLIFAMVLLFHIITEILRVNQAMEKWLVIIRKMERE